MTYRTAVAGNLKMRSKVHVLMRHTKGETASLARSDGYFLHSVIAPCLSSDRREV